MALSNEIITQFAKLATKKEKPKTESTVQGTVKYGDGLYVILDGSDLLTPVSTTIDVADGDRVNVSIKDHAATITGSTSSPAAKQETVNKVSDKTDKQGNQITEHDIIIAHKVTADEVSAVNAYIDNLKATIGNIKDLTVEDLNAINGSFEKIEAYIVDAKRLTATDIEAINGEFEAIKAIAINATNITTEDIDAVNATIDNLKAYVGNFTYITAVKADITNLAAKKLDADFANIDNLNVSVANIYKLFTEIGLFRELTSAEGTFTHELIGVKILADLIEAGTLKADRLIVKGENGLYYQLNLKSDGFAEGEEIPTEGIHGKAIIANSITADKISVTDLIALAATIGGFEITQGAIHSHGKDSADNYVRGSYLDTDGQIAFGDGNNYLRYIRTDEYHAVNYNTETSEYIAETDITDYDETVIESATVVEDTYTTEDDIVYSYAASDGATEYFCKREKYKLEIMAERIRFGHGGIQNGAGVFTNDEGEGTVIDENSVETDNVIVGNEICQKDITVDNPGEWVWAARANGNYGLVWREGE